MNIILLVVLAGCGSNSSYDQNNNNPGNNNSNRKHTTTSADCGEYKGHKLYRGDKGGCYYKHHDRKEYVDHSYCNCL
ncbi:MAG: hypothetical protein ACJ75J_09835 [Cytophagaceae bacterium]